MGKKTAREIIGTTTGVVAPLPKAYRSSRFIEFQDTKKTDWKVEFILEPSTTCLILCTICILLAIPALLGLFYGIILHGKTFDLEESTTVTTSQCGGGHIDDGIADILKFTPRNVLLLATPDDDRNIQPLDLPGLANLNQTARGSGVSEDDEKSI